MRQGMAMSTQRTDWHSPAQHASRAKADYELMTRLMSRFNVAFSLMSVIPLLTCFYLITVRFFSIEILRGLNGIYFLLALIIALLGLFAGQQLIRDIIRQLVEANTKLARLNEQQADFVGNVAHEFRTPLGVFKAALDNLSDGLHGPLTADQTEPLAMCQRQVDRLVRLVRDLLEMTRFQAGRLPMNKQEVVLQEVLTDAVRLFSEVLQKRGLKLTMDLPDAPARLTGDRDRLQQVFVNLLSNALKFTEKGDIHVGLTRDDTAFQVEVVDSGAGIPQSDLDRIFDKFEQVGPQGDEGSGLGLPIARDIISLHNGRIWAERRAEHGTRFIVRLPMTPAGSVAGPEAPTHTEGA